MKFIRWMDRNFEPCCIAFLVLTMTLVICLQIIARFFGYSFSSAEEISRYLFVWAIYLSISFAIRDQRHIRVVFFVEKLPEWGQRFCHNCADLIFLIYSVVVVYFGYVVVARSLELGQIAPATQVPVAVLYASVVVGSFINILRLGVRLYGRTKQLSIRSSGQGQGS